MNRRGFLSGILAAAIAPAIVRADSLMRIVPLDTTILTATYGDVVDRYVITGVTEGISETILTMDQIMREALRVAHEKGVFLGRINGEFDHHFKVGDVISMPAEKQGDTIRIRMRNPYKPRAV